MQWLSRAMLKLLIENTLDRRIVFMKIKDIGRVVTGKTPLTGVDEYYGGNIMFISPSDLHGDYLIEKSEKTITEEGLKSIESNSIKGISVLTGCIGWDMGNVAMCNSRCATNQQINAIIDFNDKLVDPRYVFYWLKGKKDYLFSIASVTRTPILSKSVFEDIDIPLPSLEVQKKVAKLLSLIDEKIMKNHQINDYLEQQALLIFRYMFKNISNGSNHVGDYITPKRGKALLSKDAIPGQFPVIAGGLLPATYHNRANTVAPVLTISGSGANAGYVNIWHDPIWSSDSSFIDYEMTTNVYFWYAFLKLRQQDIFDIQTGSAQPHIYPKHIAELSIGNIDRFQIASYITQVTPLFTKAGANIRETKRLQQLRDWLLPMLMNGQVTIED